MVGNVVGDVSQFLVESDAAVVVKVGGCYTGVQCFFCVKVADAFQVGVYDDRDGVVANHHVCFASVEVPYGQASVLFVEGDEGFHHVVDTFRFGVGEERMGGTVGIPQGEGAVIHPAVRLVYFFVGAVVGSVYVAVNGGGNH